MVAVSQFSHLLIVWGDVTPWLFPSLWAASGVFACMRRHFIIGAFLLLAFAADFLLSYLVTNPAFTGLGDTMHIIGIEFSRQLVYVVATLLPGIVNFSLAIALITLIRKLSKGKASA